MGCGKRVCGTTRSIRKAMSRNKRHIQIPIGANLTPGFYVPPLYHFARPPDEMEQQAQLFEAFTMMRAVTQYLAAQSSTPREQSPALDRQTDST